MQKDPLFFNKLAGAFLFGLLLLLFSGFLAELLIGGEHDEGGKKSYTVLIEENTESPATTEIVEIESIAVRLASADAQAGRKIIKKCTVCHTLNQGGINRIGPNLWGIVDSNKGVVAGFSYSDALVNSEGIWDYESLDGFLTKPRTWLPGTKMNFVGLKKPSQRANVILWMSQNK